MFINIQIFNWIDFFNLDIFHHGNAISCFTVTENMLKLWVRIFYNNKAVLRKTWETIELLKWCCWGYIEINAVVLKAFKIKTEFSITFTAIYHQGWSRPSCLTVHSLSHLPRGIHSKYFHLWLSANDAYPL